MFNIMLNVNLEAGRRLLLLLECQSSISILGLLNFKLSLVLLFCFFLAALL